MYVCLLSVTFCVLSGTFADTQVILSFSDTFELFITRIGWKLLKFTGMARYGLKWPKMAGKGSKLDGPVTFLGIKEYRGSKLRD